MEPGLSAYLARFFSPIHSIASLEKVKSDVSEVGQITLRNFLLLQQYEIELLWSHLQRCFFHLIFAYLSAYNLSFAHQ